MPSSRACIAWTLDTTIATSFLDSGPVNVAVVTTFEPNLECNCHPTSLTFVLTNSACGGKGVRVACVDGAAGSGVDTTVS